MALFTQLCPSAAVCSKASAVLADNAKSATAFLPAACQASADLPGCKDAKGGPGAHLTAGLFGSASPIYQFEPRRGRYALFLNSRVRGCIGTVKWVLMAMADHGYNDLAYEMLTQNTFPSFGWMLNNPFANATTTYGRVGSSPTTPTRMYHTE